MRNHVRHMARPVGGEVSKFNIRSLMLVAVVMISVVGLSACGSTPGGLTGRSDGRTGSLASVSATNALVLMRTAIREARTATFTAEIGATMIDASVVTTSEGALDADAYNAVIYGGAATYRSTPDGQFMKPVPETEFRGEGWCRALATGTLLPFDPRAYLSMLSTVTVEQDHGIVQLAGQEVRHLTVAVPARDMLAAQYGAAAADGAPDGRLDALRPAADVWIRVEDALPVRVLLDDGTGIRRDYRYGGWGSKVSIPTPKELVEEPF